MSTVTNLIEFGRDGASLALGLLDVVTFQSHPDARILAHPHQSAGLVHIDGQAKLAHFVGILDIVTPTVHSAKQQTQSISEHGYLQRPPTPQNG